MAHPIPTPITVVGRKYCISEYPVDLLMVRKSRKELALSRHNFTVLDIKDLEEIIIMFKLEAQWSLHDHRILRDLAGNPIVTLQKEMISMHGRWRVFRGDSREENDLLFTTKRTSWMIKTNVKMDVFLANNTKEETPDFRLDGSSDDGKCGIIYAGDGESKLILAECELLEKHYFRVIISPNVDYAFIVALIAILLDDVDASDGSELHPLLEGLKSICEALAGC